MGKVMIQFVQQGGGVLCVMVLSSVLYRLLLYNGDLDYAMGYSVNMCKIFFSIVCLSCAFFFWWLGEKEDTFGEFVISQIMMWLVVFIQIWIGFGIRCDGRLSEKSKKIDFWREKKYYMCYLLSMLIPPGVFILVLLESDRITCWMIAVAITILIQLVILLIVVVICCMVSYPTKYGSFIRTVFLVKRLYRKTKVQKSNYRGMKYEAWWENNHLCVRVLGRKVISISDKFTKAEKQQIENKIKIGDKEKFENVKARKQAEVRKMLINHLEGKRKERGELMHAFYEKARKHFEESAQAKRKNKRC
ncbi:MAG: hypothetical protein IKB01_11195 [Lachnospiraceae bacterium]|nr:hypothetical protein [Lachnospiraceae bacterium]